MMNEIEFRRMAESLDLTRTGDRAIKYRAIVVQDGKRLYCSVYRGQNVLVSIERQIYESIYAKEMAWRILDLAKRLTGEEFYLEDGAGRKYRLDHKSLAQRQRKKK